MPPGATTVHVSTAGPARRRPRSTESLRKSRIGARDARALRLKPQDTVDVVSRRGRVRSLELRVTETIAPGQVFVPFHYAEANANEVTLSEFDPISREPNYKQSAVRVERAPGIGDQGSGVGAAGQGDQGSGIGADSGLGQKGRGPLFPFPYSLFPRNRFPPHRL